MVSLRNSFKLIFQQASQPLVTSLQSQITNIINLIKSIGFQFIFYAIIKLSVIEEIKIVVINFNKLLNVMILMFFFLFFL